jgi:hypothetical protein
MHRLFICELPASLSVSRLRALGVIRADAKSVVISFGDGESALTCEVEITHHKLRNNGSWSFYRCPECQGLARILRLHEKPLCRRCLLARGIDYSSRGRTADKREARTRRVGELVERLNGGPARLKPRRYRRIDRVARLQLSLQKALVANKRQAVARAQAALKPPRGPAHPRLSKG